MPELPEVQTVVTSLRPRVVGQIIRKVHVHRADVIDPPDADLATHLTGRRVASIDRRGKRIIFTLDDELDSRFFIHLGMTGRLTINQPDTRRRPTRTSSSTSTPAACGSPTRDGSAASGGSVPAGAPTRDGARSRWTVERRNSPSGSRARPARSKTRCSTNPYWPASGNIYVDESLFAAGIHPLAPANELTAAQIGRLNKSIKTVLRRAIRNRGSTLRDYVDADGVGGSFQTCTRSTTARASRAGGAGRRSSASCWAVGRRTSAAVSERRVICVSGFATTVGLDAITRAATRAGHDATVAPAAGGRFAVSHPGALPSRNRKRLRSWSGGASAVDRPWTRRSLNVTRERVRALRQTSPRRVAAQPFPRREILRRVPQTRRQAPHDPRHCKPCHPHAQP
jgi:formamidopyrimidine-DNA glycosylase